MARLPFERINVSPQFNRLSAPNVPNAPQPVNLSNAGMNAQYQSLTSFANSLNSLGAAFAQRAAQEKNEKDRLELESMGVDLDGVAKNLEIQFKSEPPKDTEDALATLDNLLFGIPTENSLARLAKKEIKYEELKREGGMLSAFKQKYGNTQKVNNLLEQFQVNQYFLSTGLGIQNIHNANTAKVKKDFMQYSADLMNRDIPEELATFSDSLNQAELTESNTPQSLLTTFSEESYREKTLKEIEEAFDQMTEKLNPVHQQNLKSEMMPALMKLADARQSQFEMYAKQVGKNNYNESRQLLLEDSFKSQEEKMNEIVSLVDAGSVAGYIPEDQKAIEVQKFEKQVQLDFAYRAIAQAPDQVIAAFETEKDPRKRFVEVDGRVESLELNTLSAKQKDTIYRAANTKLKNNLEESVAKLKNDIINLKRAALTDPSVPEAEVLLLRDQILGRLKGSILEVELNKHHAEIEFGLSLRDHIPRIPDMNSNDIKQFVQETMPEYDINNDAYSSQVSMFNTWKKEFIDPVLEERAKKPALFTESSIQDQLSVSENLRERLGPVSVFNKDYIVQNFTNQYNVNRPFGNANTLETDLQNLDNKRLQTLIDSGLFQFYTPDAQDLLIDQYRGAVSIDAKRDFMFAIEQQSKEFAPLVFHQLMKTPEEGGIGFNPADFFLTEVSNNKVAEKFFIANAEGQEKFLKESIDTYFSNTDVQISDVEKAVIEDEFFKTLIGSFSFAGPSDLQVRDTTLKAIRNYVMYEANTYFSNFQKPLSIDSAIARANEQIRKEFKLVNSSNLVSGLFSDDTTKLVIPKYRFPNPELDDNLLSSTLRETAVLSFENIKAENKAELQVKYVLDPNNNGLLLTVLDKKDNTITPLRDVRENMTLLESLGQGENPAQPIVYTWDEIATDAALIKGKMPPSFFEKVVQSVDDYYSGRQVLDEIDPAGSLKKEFLEAIEKAQPTGPLIRDYVYDAVIPSEESVKNLPNFLGESIKNVGPTLQKAKEAIEDRANEGFRKMFGETAAQRRDRLKPTVEEEDIDQTVAPKERVIQEEIQESQNRIMQLDEEDVTTVFTGNAVGSFPETPESEQVDELSRVYSEDDPAPVFTGRPLGTFPTPAAELELDKETRIFRAIAVKNYEQRINLGLQVKQSAENIIYDSAMMLDDDLRVELFNDIHEISKLIKGFKRAQKNVSQSVDSETIERFKAVSSLEPKNLLELNQKIITLRAKAKGKKSDDESRNRVLDFLNKMNIKSLDPEKN